MSDESKRPDLDAIEARANAASPKTPWSSVEERSEQASAAAGLRTDVPELVAYARRLEGENESLRLAYEMLCKREPTAREGDAFQQRPMSSEDNECFVPAGGWTGRRCRACGRWVWGGPTACEGCVRREERDEARDCGQDDVCATPPGCQRHWEERCRELVQERDRLQKTFDDAGQGEHEEEP